MSLTRDDMLRELELLPAWQLRQPVAKARYKPLARGCRNAAINR